MDFRREYILTVYATSTLLYYSQCKTHGAITVDYVSATGGRGKSQDHKLTKGTSLLVASSVSDSDAGIGSETCLITETHVGTTPRTARGTKAERSPSTTRARTRGGATCPTRASPLSARARSSAPPQPLQPGSSCAAESSAPPSAAARPGSAPS